MVGSLHGECFFPWGELEGKFLGNVAYCLWGGGVGGEISWEGGILSWGGDSLTLLVAFLNHDHP